MTYEIATVLCGGPGLSIPNGEKFNAIDNRDNRRTPCQAYQQALEMTNSEVDVLIYMHDDVSVIDPQWLDKIMMCFSLPISTQHPKMPNHVVAVGLGGATALGNHDLYRTPYNIWNMARRGYASNQTDAEVHGDRFSGVRNVAVLDAFCLAVKTDWIRSRGGWPVDHITHHCLDLWLACEAARDNKEIWMVGASCTHHGGGTSTKEAYAKAPWLLGGSREADHSEPHRWLYNEYRDVLPIVLQGQCGLSVGPGIWCPLSIGHGGFHGRSDDPSLPQNKGNGQT